MFFHLLHKQSKFAQHRTDASFMQKELGYFADSSNRIEQGELYRRQMPPANKFCDLTEIGLGFYPERDFPWQLIPCS